MSHKQKFTVDTEIPYELKKKGLNLDLANKWQKYYVEGCSKKIEGSRYYAWIKLLTNYRSRREGWVKATGQWSVADKNEFADLLWGVWHACKRRHFPSEVEWMDNFIYELAKIRNGIVEKEESDEIQPVDPSTMLVDVSDEEETVTASPPPPVAEEDDGMDLDEDEEFTKEGSMGGGLPPAVEDDGSDEEEVVRTKPKKALKRKKGKK